MRGPLFRPQTVCGQRSGQSPRLQGTPEARRLTGTVGARRSGNAGRLAPPRCHGGSCLAVFRAARTGRRGRGGCTRGTWRRPSPPFPLARLPSAFSPATAEPARASERGAEGGGHPPTRSSIHSSQPVRVREVTGACLGPGWLPEGHNPRIWPRLQASAYARTSAQPPRPHRPRASPASGICPAPAICLAGHSAQHVTCEQGADPSEATLVRARALRTRRAACGAGAALLWHGDSLARPVTPGSDDGAARARPSRSVPLAAPPTRRASSAFGPLPQQAPGATVLCRASPAGGMRPAGERAGARPASAPGRTPGGSEPCSANVFSFLLGGGWTEAKERLTHPFQGQCISERAGSRRGSRGVPLRSPQSASSAFPWASSPFSLASWRRGPFGPRNAPLWFCVSDCLATRAGVLETPARRAHVRTTPCHYLLLSPRRGSLEATCDL